MSTDSKTPETDGLAGSMREWITPDGPRVVMIADRCHAKIHEKPVPSFAPPLSREVKEEPKLSREEAGKAFAPIFEMLEKLK